MKGLGKKLLSMALVIAFAFSMVTTSYASTVLGSNSKLIEKKTDSQYAGYTKVEDPNTQKGTFTLNVQRPEDEFEAYLLTTLTWSTSEATGATNVVVSWVPAVQAWIEAQVENTESPFYGLEYYLSPKELGEHEDANADGDFGDLTDKIHGDEDKADPDDDEQSVIALLRAMREDDTLLASLKANNKVAWHNGEDPLTGLDEEDGDSINSSSKVVPSNATVLPEYTESDDVKTFSNAYKVKDAPLGVIFINAKSTGREYQPVLVDLMPEQVGPTGNWYIDDPEKLKFSLKYEDVGLEKKINGYDEDIVRIGEIVTFTVTVQIPKYPLDGDNYRYTTLNLFDDMTQGFTLIPTSAVLKYKDASGNIYHPKATLEPDDFGNLIVSDQENTYKGYLNSTSYVYYDKTTDLDVDIYGTVTTPATDTTPEEVSFWGLVNGQLVDLGNSTPSLEVYSSVISAYGDALAAAGLPRPTVTAANLEKRDYTKSVISLVCNYTNMKTTLKQQDKDEKPVPNTSFEPEEIIVTYDAIINENMYIGTDQNTNIASMYYVGDSSGKLYTTEDKVKAWTYATNIVKVDGDLYQKTPIYKRGDDGEYLLDGSGNKIQDQDANGNLLFEEPEGTYLDETFFDIYRLDATYCGGIDATAEPDLSAQDVSGLSTYEFLTNSEGKNYDEDKAAWVGTPGKGYSDGLLYKAAKYYVTTSTEYPNSQWATEIGSRVTGIVGSTTDYSTLDKYTTKYASAALYPEMFKSFVLTQADGMKYFYLAEKVDSCDAGIDTPHYHVHCYSILYTGVESEADSDGKTVIGMDPSTYIVIETQAKTGYHKLATGMQFEVKKYGSDEYNAAGESSKGFIDEDDNNVEDGVYKMLVKNYKGLVLPSTGGMGTLIFTVIGIMVMTMAVVVIVVKRRKDVVEY